MQQKVSDMVWADMVPELNKLFDSMVNEDEILRFDTLELDLGEVTFSENNTKNIVEKVISLLKEELINKKQKLQSGSIESEDVWKVNSQKTKSEHYFNIWLYWLRKGMLPSYTIPPKDDWIEFVLETLALNSNAVLALKKLLEKHPTALKRLVLQHDPQQLKSITELYTGYAQSNLLVFFEELKAIYKTLLLKKKEPFRKLEIALWKSVFQQVIIDEKKLNTTEICENLIGLPEFNPVIKELNNVTRPKKNQYPFLYSTLKKNPKIQLDATVYTKDENKVEIETIETPSFFKNAGVVLLHPFLSALFRKLNLLENNEFKDFESQSKAVLLIHYLATENEKPHEYEMVLPKFLCNMPVNMPVDHTLIITKDEKIEVNNVLGAAIEHWGALGNVSPDSLREGFLIREGKLEKEASGWKLYVEHKTLDVLLDKLPWNLSIIKLPWMNDMLKVEWR
ncbi:hypothetical protein J8H85_10115 [Mariniflexile gromovii]|uniref:Uncharacterized protein n=2 Tax=Mariniflexile gromovii TaxID=362523 RepID=A0ABS4BUX1_9FLAO|nr:hypothetical protein [Mariniflexile gromovii]